MHGVFHSSRKELTDGSARIPYVLVALSIGYNLWTLRAQRLIVSYLNDSAVHVSMVDWARHRILAGHLPFDGWFPDLGLGSPLFHRYQSLPHIITGAVAVLFGTKPTFAWSGYLLLALWPLAVYWGTRLLGWGRWTAALAALVSPLIVSKPGLGYEFSSYTWQGYGVWSQLWGMWLLPIALGLSWRAVHRGRGYALAAFVLALTIACHLITGYLGLCVVAAWAVLLKPSEMLRRAGRGLLVTIGAVVAASFALIPLLLDTKWTTQDDRIINTFYTNSFGAKHILGWLFTGRLFDSGRLPVVSVLAGVGAVVCIVRWKRDERARALLVGEAVSLVLFFGKPTLGPLFHFLPLSGNILFRRFIMGVHLFGILLAGVGAAWVGARLLEAGRRIAPNVKPILATGVLSVALVGFLWPAWHSRASYSDRGAALIARQRFFDDTEGAGIVRLIQEARSRGPGRIYAGLDTNWGYRYRVGYVPMYDYLLEHGADSVGRAPTPSLSRNVEERFDDTKPGLYRLFGIRYAILPQGRRPPTEATAVAREGHDILWELAGNGYAQVVDVGFPIAANRRTLGPVMAPLLASKQAGTGPLPAVAYPGITPAPPTVAPGLTPAAPPGRVSREFDGPQDGFFAVHVHADRPAMALIKTSFDPRWRVSVDGVPVSPQMVAPSFLGREVSAGVHGVVFQYSPFPHYDVLFALGALALLGLYLIPRTNWRRLWSDRRWLRRRRE